MKQFLRITSLIIICTQHFGSKRFPKAPWSANTCQIPWRIDCLINQTYHFCFIDINVISHIRKPAVSRIQITSHLCLHLPRMFLFKVFLFSIIVFFIEFYLQFIRPATSIFSHISDFCYVACQELSFVSIEVLLPDSDNSCEMIPLTLAPTTPSK